jgi:hypothetical protein
MIKRERSIESLLDAPQTIDGFTGDRFLQKAFDAIVVRDTRGHPTAHKPVLGATRACHWRGACAAGGAAPRAPPAPVRQRKCMAGIAAGV